MGGAAKGFSHNHLLLHSFIPQSQPAHRSGQSGPWPDPKTRLSALELQPGVSQPCVLTAHWHSR